LKKLALGVIVIFTAFTLGCIDENVVWTLGKSLPQGEFAIYNDSFNTLKDDMWRIVAPPSKRQIYDNFWLAETKVENGNLIMETETGGFSEGRLVSKFVLWGDFDIQIDVHFEFDKRSDDMDQVVGFLINDVTKQIEKRESVFISLCNAKPLFYPYVATGRDVGGEITPGKNISLGYVFDGSLRILRKGNNTRLLIKNAANNNWWNELFTVAATHKNVSVAVYVKNYVVNRTEIKAEKTFTANFDNFKINAARMIIEPDVLTP
jgi:hypothetical protein